MATQEDIDHQFFLLKTYRRNLKHILTQTAQYDPKDIPQGHLNTIIDNRANIARIKTILRNWHINVDNHPDDKETLPAQEVNVKINADKVMLVMPIAEFSRMLQVNPELLQFVVYKS